MGEGGYNKSNYVRKIFLKNKGYFMEVLKVANFISEFQILMKKVMKY